VNISGKKTSLDCFIWQPNSASVSNTVFHILIKTT